LGKFFSNIFVKQYGQAAYGFEESEGKFSVLSGFLKTFWHSSLEQIYVLLSLFTNAQVIAFSRVTITRL